MKNTVISWEDFKSNLETKSGRSSKDEENNEEIWDSLDQLIVLTVIENMYPGLSVKLLEIYNIKNLKELRQYLHRLEFKIV